MQTGLLPDSLVESLPFLIPFGIIGIWRWGLYLLRVVFWFCYRPIQPKKAPDTSGTDNKYKTSDVTIVVPTIDNGPEFLISAHLWKKNNPHEVIIVTSKEMEVQIRESCRQVDPHLFRVLTVDKPNKRVQLMKGVHAATTDIIALSDDDAIWTAEFLLWMLAPFDDDKMGGVGSHQEMVPVGSYETVWEVIADFRLTMRMIETAATTFVDGGMSCLSGRTAVYRREILQDPKFEEEFVNEKWLGKYALHSGDDKFITRWLVKNNWNMQMQNHPEASLKTTFKNDNKFINQVLRWTRNTWRSDIQSCFVERAIWYRHPYVAFNMLDKFINPLPLLYGLTVIFFNLFKHGAFSVTYVLLPVAAWLLVSRCLRLIPHIVKKPRHIIYVPAMILFQYFFNLMKIYALFTLHITDWGSRASADGHDDADQTDRLADQEIVPTASETGSCADSGSGGRHKDRSVYTTDEELSTAESGTAVTKEQEHPFVPWYRRPSVIVGALWFVFVILALKYLVVVSIEYDPNWEFWTVSILTTGHALSSDRATGVGVYDPVIDKTFVTHAGPNMNPVVMAYDHKTKTISNGEKGSIVGKSHETLFDYHDYPKMIIDDEGHLLVAWTNHPAGQLHVSRSPQPHSAEGQWSQQLLDTGRPTYPCMIKDSTGTIYIWYRVTITTDYRPYEYVKSTDNGATWSKPHRAIDSGGLAGNKDPQNVNEIYADCPRLFPAEDGGLPERFAMGWTNSGGGPGIELHNNYHKDAHFVYFYPFMDSFVTAAGKNLGATIDYDEMKSCVAFDSGVLDENNKHAIDYYFAPSYINGTHVFMVFNYNRTLQSAMWDGSQWVHSTISDRSAKALFDLEKTGAESFRLFHAGGDDVNVFTTSDGGMTWVKGEEEIKPGIGSFNKVVLVENSHPDMRLIAMETDFSERDYTGKYRVYGIGENPDLTPAWRTARTPDS